MTTVRSPLFDPSGSTPPLLLARDLRPVLDGLGLSPAPAPARPPEPQPVLTTAVCEPPVHRCGAVRARALRQGLPMLTLHLHPHQAELRLIAHKPWEVTSASRAALLNIFACWASLDLGFTSAHRAMVERTVVSYLVPRAVAERFAKHVASAAVFERVVL